MIPPYSSTTRRRDIGVAAAFLVATIGLGGCSVGLPSIVPEPAEDLTTGSIKPPADARISPDLGPEDWRRAKGALAIALDLHGNGRTVKWDNPETRFRGEITPAGPPFVQKDEICRRFAATVVNAAGKASQHAGHACRLSVEEWQIKIVARSRS